MKLYITIDLNVFRIAISFVKGIKIVFVFVILVLILFRFDIVEEKNCSFYKRKGRR